MSTATIVDIVTVFRIQDQLTIATREAFRKTVEELIANGTKRIVLDFTNAKYVDAYGLGVLVSIDKLVRNAGAHMIIAALNDDMRTLFQLTRLDTLFVIADTVELAKAFARMHA